MADIHLGAFREPRLREANLDAFLNALDICLAEKVDFILICGDLFHTSLPDMGVVERAAGKLRQVIDAGMPVYVIYGSHDFSAAERSMVDVLHSAGVFVKVARASVSEEGTVRLEGTVDERTGTVIAGLSGRKLGLDKSYYDKLDVGAALQGAGPRIFAFHAAITELKPKELARMQDAMPVSLLPKGFDYYAGGHVHARMQAEMPGWGTVAYPGPLFGDGYRDLEDGEPRGFFIVRLETGKPPGLSFREVPARKTKVIDVDADGRAPEDVNADLKKKAEAAGVGEAIVLVKVAGELSTGKASDVDTEGLRKTLAQNDAFVVYVNRGGLSTKERANVRIDGDSRSEIESKLLKELLAGQPSNVPELKDGEGLRRAQALLGALREEQKGGTRADYERAVIRATEGILFGGWKGAENIPAEGEAVQEAGDMVSEGGAPQTEATASAKKEAKQKRNAEKKNARGKQQRLE
jgi:DNA repair exonuclease SbcCD nuclease subunit